VTVYYCDASAHHELDCAAGRWCTVRVNGGAWGDRSITVIESGNSSPRRRLESPSLALTIRSGADETIYGGPLIPRMSTVVQPAPDAAANKTNVPLLRQCRIWVVSRSSEDYCRTAASSRLRISISTRCSGSEPSFFRFSVSAVSVHLKWPVSKSHSRVPAPSTASATRPLDIANSTFEPDRRKGPVDSPGASRIR
jgi:hypothetical protein